MNRHQSNPFLAGWEESDDGGALVTAVYKKDASIIDDDQLPTEDSNNNIQRRSSSGGVETDSASGNPFSAQRSADRRLYHRNMSSFEAASLQLEQQQLQGNGAAGVVNQIDAEQTELIARMTADFQNAMETRDKGFTTEDEACAFDPFETIVDDDISIPSPANTNQIHQTDDKFFKNDNNKHQQYDGVERPETIDLDSKTVTATKTLHDSIDEDEEDLVSTPVRNIKSTPQKIVQDSDISNNLELNDHVGGSCVEPESSASDAQMSTELMRKNQDHSNGQNEETDSMAKASIFASLLATAELSGQQTSGDFEGTEINNISPINIEENPNNEELAVSSMEHATHVIKGSHTDSDGSSGRPVSFFDPFETVIDKDALTSLMHDNQQSTSPKKQMSDDELNLGYAPPTRTPEPTPIHHRHTSQNVEITEDLSELVLDSDHRHNRIAESVSIETVIENPPSNGTTTDHESVSNSMTLPPLTDPKHTTTTTTTTTAKKNSIASSEDDQVKLPRPTAKPKDADIQQTSTVSTQDSNVKLQTPAKKSKPKKKPSFQEDSSDSSDNDDRIQIVIKARPTTQAENQVSSTFVPLLPPPPSKSSMKQARERGQVEDMPSPVMSYKTRHQDKTKAQNANVARDSFDDSDDDDSKHQQQKATADQQNRPQVDLKEGEEKKGVHGTEYENDHEDDDDDEKNQDAFVIPMTHSDDEGDTYGKPDTPLYDEDTSYVLDDFPAKYEGSGWEMMLRYPPKKKLTSNRFWKKIFVKLAQVPLANDGKTSKHHDSNVPNNEPPQTCLALQIFDKPEDKKPMQEIPIQATYTVSEISNQQYDQFGKIFTLKLQYIFYKERVGVRQGQLARFIHTGHIGSSTTSGGHGADPISIGAIKRLGAPIEHSPQVSQIIKLGCTSYSEIKQFKNCLEDYLFNMPINRDRALSTYKTEEVQMAVRDETYIELNQVGTIIKQLARVRLFFLSFLNGSPTVEVGINDIHRQGKEVVGRMDILPVVTEEWIRLEACELHSTVNKEDFENPETQIIKLVPPDATFFELMRFRIRPPRNRELPLQISANMSITRTKVTINCDVMVPGCVSRKHGQIPCEGIAIKVFIPECWIYFFREEKHFRMGSKKSVNRRPGKVKGIERFLGGGGTQDINDESSLIEVTSGQAKYEHHHHSIVWRAARWPKETQSAYVQNTMRIRLPLTAFDKMPESFYEYIHVEYTMPATTVSHTTLRSISVNPCDDEPPEKYVKYSAKYEYKVKMRLSVNLGAKPGEQQPEASPIVIMKQPDLQGDLQREEDSADEDDEDEDEAGAGSSDKE